MKSFASLMAPCGDRFSYPHGYLIFPTCFFGVILDSVCP